MDILMQLKHPHVIRLIQAMQTPFARDLIFEYCTCDLSIAMKLASGDSKQFQLAPFWRITRQICSGLAYVHEKDIVHRDLKPANVLVQETGSTVNVKIGDFGLARRVPRRVSHAMPALGVTTENCYISYVGRLGFHPGRFFLGPGGAPM